MEVVVRVPESVMDHGVDEFAVEDPVPESCLVKEIRAVGHAFHASCDDAVCIP